ncbi:hypothetical protein PCANC_09397 [Puccinia coronata f. sp. avenae]|uniref:Uncharacterized protein n=1 Tax=Puccinia coronata f. sp. avenae TaxID=200324 RepID=A0A2N5VDC3_9BASI|nr:hypothetical protein PCANC_09397 [Puccinia coronata f. sp. avenae]
MPQACGMVAPEFTSDAAIRFTIGHGGRPSESLTDSHPGGQTACTIARGIRGFHSDSWDFGEILGFQNLAYHTPKKAHTETSESGPLSEF